MLGAAIDRYGELALDDATPFAVDPSDDASETLE